MAQPKILRGTYITLFQGDGATPTELFTPICGINTRTMTSVKSILLNRLDGRRLVQPPEAPPITHANIRGPKFFH